MDGGWNAEALKNVPATVGNGPRGFKTLEANIPNMPKRYALLVGVSCYLNDGKREFTDGRKVTDGTSTTQKGCSQSSLKFTVYPRLITSRRGLILFALIPWTPWWHTKTCQLPCFVLCLDSCFGLDEIKGFVEDSDIWHVLDLGYEGRDSKDHRLDDIGGHWLVSGAFDTFKGVSEVSA
ncbi:hypothetical protein CIB48_g8024 [Xylaria polymorpha]|nr:hypothetical protein CIB48_g8024 [Xylaria polymorpha]